MRVRAPSVEPVVLKGRRIVLRTLRDNDFDGWSGVRTRCRDWLVPWEPRMAGATVPTEDRRNFAARCSMRERERQLGTGYGFGIFVSGRFLGELTLSSVQRGPFQNASIGYWIDEAEAGHGYVPEAVVTCLRFAFHDLGLHRVEICIIPRNAPSRRVVEKLGIRFEGIAERLLCIDGVWEDHARYAITTEEWATQGPSLVEDWLG
jgi:[ribosomal protein S5]-alanine N-acetyltransferase